LLGSYTDIPNRAIRRRLIQLVDEIANATRKTKSKSREKTAA
jgi:hypothetical protein